MPGPTLTADEMAAELGRSTSWIYDNWRKLCGQHRMPMPIQESVPLVWSRAQVYAWLDRNLPAKDKVTAAAYRAAFDAALATHEDGRLASRRAQSRRQINALLGREANH